MAAGYKDFTAGSALAAADLEDYCELQSAMRFASVAARDAALASVKTAGMLAINTDLNQLAIYDGTGWVILAEPAQTWTPTITGITTTSGTWVADYHRRDGWCDYVAELTFGASSAITGETVLTLPVAAAGTTVGLHEGSFYDSSAGSTFQLSSAYTGVNTTMRFRAINTAGTYATGVATSATIPVAFGTGDKLTMRGSYRMTTRYS